MKDRPIKVLAKEMAKIGNGISEMDLERCLERAGLHLMDSAAYERWSWTVSPDRMGS